MNQIRARSNLSLICLSYDTKRNSWDYAQVLRRLLKSCESCRLSKAIRASTLIS